MQMKKAEEALLGIKEIARRASVSIATVDRVLHNRTGVSARTRDKINGIIQELNYQPNILARRLASRKVIRFAVLIPKISNETEFWQAPLLGIEQAAASIRQYGIKIEKFFFDQNDQASFDIQSRLILEEKVNGVLLAPNFIEESIQFTNACRKQDIPYIFINSDIPHQESLSYIGPDLFRSGYLGAHLINYLFEVGKILLVNISRDINNNYHYLLRKEDGVRSYYKDHQTRKEVLKVDIRQTDYASIKEKLSDVLAREPSVKAIFVTNSRVSSVAHFLEEAGITDKRLIGFDFLKENIDYLKKGTIDFLICHKPQEQGYRGIMALYNSIVQHSPIEKCPSTSLRRRTALFTAIKNSRPEAGPGDIPINPTW
jgi:LacI family transcriptional regulator